MIIKKDDGTPTSTKFDIEVTSSIIMNLVVIILSFITAFFWVFYATSILDSLKEDDYSRNQLLGSRLSLVTDLRALYGTRMSSNGYAYFLSHAIQTIGEKPFTQPFVLESQLPRWMWNLDGIERAHRIAPRTDDLLTFGVQSTVTFSLAPIESFPERLISQWVLLVGDSGTEIPALVVDGSPTHITVRGNIPPWFFANEIVSSASSGRLDEAVDFVMTSSLAASVRGGLVSDPNKQTLHLWHAPWTRFQNAFHPRPGDQIEFSDRSRASIATVHEFDRRYLVTLEDPSFRPYFDNRSDVVTLRRRTQGFGFPISLRVNTASNSDFLNGRERYHRVALGNRESLKPGTILAVPRAESAYVISRIDEDVVTLDLRRSFALQLCLAATRESNKRVQLAEEEIMSSWSRKNCFDENSPPIRYLSDEIGNWHMLPQQKKYLITDIFQSTSHLTWTELWSKSLFMDMVSKGVPTADQESGSVPRFRNEDELIWEIYPGSMLNIYYGEINPAPINLMIHVLGAEDRANYYNKFAEEKPEFFVFAKPHAHTPWIVNWHWPVFENVLLNYEETFSNVDFSLWRRRDDEWRIGSEEGVVVEAPTLPLTVPELFADPIDACRLRVARVSVDYEIDNPWGFLPLVGRSDRMLITAEDTGIGLPPRTPASLPPESGRFSFPIVYRAGAQPRLVYDQFSPFGRFADLKILRIHFTPLEADQAAVRGLFLENDPFKALADAACPPAEDSAPAAGREPQ